jgi:hypothetical protein
MDNPQTKPGLFTTEVSVVNKAPVPAPGEKPSEMDVFLADLEKTRGRLGTLLPIADILLTPDQQLQAQNYQMAQLVLGPAASAPMLCSKQCPTPFRNVCMLAQLGKEPIGKRCPWEQQYTMERFLSWMGELGRTLVDILESERSMLQVLVTIDLQERRCNMILADAQNAMLTSRAVRDVDVNTGVPLCWEDVIHANALRMDSLITQRRMILKDLELTPEAQTRRKKSLGLLKEGGGKDLSSKQSEANDRLRRAMRPGGVIDV